MPRYAYGSLSKRSDDSHKILIPLTLKTVALLCLFRKHFMLRKARS